MGAVLGLCSAVPVRFTLQNPPLRNYFYRFVARMLLREHCVLVMLCSMSFVPQFDIVEDNVCPDAVVGHHSGLHHAITRPAGRPPKGTFLHQQLQQLSPELGLD